jgi:hypothetical protein
VFFAYSEALSKFDHRTVITVIRDYFFGCLGEDVEEAEEMFASLQSGWGNVAKTEAGNEFAHMFKMIEISLKTQTRFVPVFGEKYTGGFLFGNGYSLIINNEPVTITEASKFNDMLIHTDQHLSTLASILKKINFASDDDRIGHFTTCKRMWDLKVLLEGLSLNGGSSQQDSVLKLAKTLNFQNDRPYKVTAHNIAEVLSFISDPSKDLATLPYLHHTQLFSNNRMHIARSAFGHTAPSFRIAGGKVMSLLRPFTITARNGKSKGEEERTITKIGAQVVPLDLAIRHLQEVVDKKEILNPFANARTHLSDDHIHKAFEKESCSTLVAALRKVAGATVMDAGGSSRKRGNDESGPSGRKKAKLTDF